MYNTVLSSELSSIHTQVYVLSLSLVYAERVGYQRKPQFSEKRKFDIARSIYRGFTVLEYASFEAT